MTGSDECYAEHDAFTRAPAGRAYQLVADVSRWPLLFAPCLHVDLLRDDPRDQRFRIWVTAGGEVRSWTSRRRLDGTALRVEFGQENPSPPFAAVSGSWRFEPAGEGTRIVLAHRWRLTDPGPGVTAWVAEALDRNSTQEVDAVRFWAQRPEDQGELLFSGTDEVTVDATPDRVYDFLYRADRWPRHVPHVARLDLQTTGPTPMSGGAEVQTMQMDTKAPDGKVHSTRSLRLCFPGRRILYKQTELPRPLKAHSGAWVISAAGAGRTRMSVRHDVALDPAAIEDAFGAGTTPAQARAAVGQALRANSLRTLERACG